MKVTTAKKPQETPIVARKKSEQIMSKSNFVEEKLKEANAILKRVGIPTEWQKKVK